MGGEAPGGGVEAEVAGGVVDVGLGVAGLEVLEAGEGAVELTFVAGFVTEDEVEDAGVVGEVADGEGGGCGRVIGRDDAAFGAVGQNLMLDAGGFPGPDALLAPPGADGFFDEGAFDVIAGAEVVVEAGEEVLEHVGVFAGHDEAAGEDAVAEAVEGRVVATARRDRAAGFGAVGARGGGAGFGSGTFGSHVALIVNYGNKEIGRENGEVVEELES